MKIMTHVSWMAAVLLMSGCSEPVKVERDTVPRVKVVAPGGKASDRLYFPAVANAAERSHLSFRVAGEISKFNVKEGARVKKGDILAEIEPTDYRLAVDNAQARFSVVDSQYRRSQPLVEKGLLAKSQFDEIAAQRQIARAELELAKLRLSFTQLRAPMDGIISRVSAEQFESVQVGQQIVNIHNIDSVEVLIQLPDRLYATQPNSHELAQIETIVRVPSGKEYPAQVKEFTTEPDPATGTFTVTLSLPMPEQELILDGMAVEVSAKGQDIGLNPLNTISVPIEAIFNADGDDLKRSAQYIWVLNRDNTVSKRQVRLTKASRSHVQVSEGVNAGDRLVIAGVSRLRDGMKVQVLEERGHE
ncbi:efflux RND transporter periplasmic adaptor subunit [Vibrio sp. RC586]|uniref:efflux RND transporter periplasmic adaptor subunit n=1 Tax=Vibrio sp. RC586 TaxID=675815 RepID=UPI0002F909B8|nr:efflux RND transporter periplasmic adaptor subunit [Vibrio sp. RC586]